MRRTVYLCILALAVSLAAGNVLGAEDTSGASGTDDNAPGTATNMESWQEEDRKDSWTWFGMGYESRRSNSQTPVSPNQGTPGRNGHGGKKQ